MPIVDRNDNMSGIIYNLFGRHSYAGIYTMARPDLSISRTVSHVERLRRGLGPAPPAVANPVMVVISGLPGSGKSYFGRRLVEQVPLLVIESDALRKVLFRNPTHSGTESARLFDACHALIDEQLEHRVPLLIDATNLVEDHRERLYQIAEQNKAKVVHVHVTAPSEVVYRRLEEREMGANPEDHSSADWLVYRNMHFKAEPIRRSHFVVDTSQDISPAVANVVREIRRWMGSPG